MLGCSGQFKNQPGLGGDAWAPVVPVVDQRGCPTKIGPKNGVFFSENGGLNINFYFQNPKKAHPCKGPHLLTYFA